MISRYSIATSVLLCLQGSLSAVGVFAAEPIEVRPAVYSPNISKGQVEVQPVRFIRRGWVGPYNGYSNSYNGNGYYGNGYYGGVGYGAGIYRPNYGYYGYGPGYYQRYGYGAPVYSYGYAYPSYGTGAYYSPYGYGYSFPSTIIW